MGKDKNNEKKMKNPSFFKELGVFMKPYSGKYAASIAVSILGVASNLASYAFAGLICSAVFSGSADVHRIMIYTVLSVACKVVNALLLNVSTWISHHAAYDTLRDIRLAISAKMLRMPMGYFGQHGSGRLKTMMVDRIESMEKTLAHVLPEMTSNVLVPLALFIWMFFIDWRLALCCILWIIIGFSVTGGMMKNYEEKFAGQLAASKSMNQAIVEYAGGIEVIKNFGRADESYGKYHDAVHRHADYNVGWQKETQIYSALGMAIAPFTIFPVLIAGLIFFEKGTIAAGPLCLMMLLTLGVFKPLMQAMTYFDQVAQMGTDAKEIKDVLEYPELARRESGKSSAHPVQEKSSSDTDITFENVTFHYDMNSEPAVKNISFHVPSGTMFALAGPSGSGKSTIARLLAGYWDADGGCIKIGGIPVSQYSQEELNSLIAYVDQETFLFGMSIMDNIRIGRPGAPDSEVIEAAVKAGCDGFIRKLPDGYMTDAGEAGGKLSGGQRQRIAIARAMMKDAPVMILDEATASSDPENEAAIQKSLSAAAAGKTLIVVAHRLSTIMNAQQIAFVKDGEIITSGTHAELLEKSDEYASMWHLSEEE